MHLEKCHVDSTAVLITDELCISLRMHQDLLSSLIAVAFAPVWYVCALPCLALSAVYAEFHIIPIPFPLCFPIPIPV